MRKDAPVRVLAVGNYACANIGDELLLATLKQWVQGAGGELTAITLNPSHTQALHGIDAVSYYDLPAIAALCRTADIMVLGGGGIFTDRFKFTLPQLYTYPAFTLAQFASVCHLAKQFDLLLVLWGQGVGPLMTADARQIVADVFAVADRVTVRDSGSASLLRELGVTRNVAVAPDPVWALSLPARGIDLRVRFPELAGKKILIVNPLVFERSEEMSVKVSTALQNVLDDGWGCLWVAFQKSAVDYDAYHFAMPSDRPLIEKMVARVGPRCPHVIWDDPHIEDLLPAFGQAEAAVMARFHGAILGLRASIPIVLIEYDDKVSQAARMAGVPANQRLKIEDSVESYTAALRRLLGQEPDSPPWHAEAATLQALAEAAEGHRKAMIETIATARTRTRMGWQAGRYDWLLAWCTQIDAKRWEAERKLWKLTDELALVSRRMEEQAQQNAQLRERLASTHPPDEAWPSSATPKDPEGRTAVPRPVLKLCAPLRRLCAKLYRGKC